VFFLLSLIVAGRLAFLAHDELGDERDDQNKHKSHHEQFLKGGLCLPSREDRAEKADHDDEDDDRLQPVHRPSCRKAAH